MVGIDFIGKLVKTDHQNQYIFVIIDYCTKWAQAYPLTNKSAEEVTTCILKCIYQFEVPKRILTDQGREFVNTVSVFIFNYTNACCSSLFFFFFKHYKILFHINPVDQH